MILLDNFFIVQNRTVEAQKAQFRIKLNAAHPIYQAHFPNNPITPGVCLIQMVTELFGMLKETKFNIKSLKNVKFTAPINPLEFSEMDFVIDFVEKEDHWQLKAVVQEKETVFSKITMYLI